MDNWERIIREEEEELGDEEIEEQMIKIKKVRAGGSDGLVTKFGFIIAKKREENSEK